MSAAEAIVERLDRLIDAVESAASRMSDVHYELTTLNNRVENVEALVAGFYDDEDDDDDRGA
jgi:hypothetical protein